MCVWSGRASGAVVAVGTLLVLVVVSLAACGSQEATSTTAAAQPEEATVSAASSLKAAFTEIGKAFDAANNSETTFNFDASGTLQKQIEGGAPVDVFASAATKQMNALIDQSLVDKDSVRVFAGNGIVLVVPSNSKLAISGFEDLARADVRRITYGDPKIAPHGVAAEEILRALGIYDQVRPKVIYATMPLRRRRTSRRAKSTPPSSSAAKRKLRQTRSRSLPRRTRACTHRSPIRSPSLLLADRRLSVGPSSST